MCEDIVYVICERGERGDKTGTNGEKVGSAQQLQWVEQVYGKRREALLSGKEKKRNWGRNRSTRGLLRFLFRCDCPAITRTIKTQTFVPVSTNEKKGGRKEIGGKHKSQKRPNKWNGNRREWGEIRLPLLDR